MAPRLNKRQQREQEELLALGGRAASPDAESSGVDDEIDPGVALPAKTKKSQAGFAALMAADGLGDEDEDEGGQEGAGQVKSKAKKSKKKKKKDTGNITPSVAPAAATLNPEPESIASPTSPEPATPSTPSTSKAERKALKKKKAKEKKDGRDDIDKALAELSVKYPDLKEVSARTSGPSAPATRKLALELNPLLSVSLTHLDADAEMRKFFGSRVVSASNQSSEGSGTNRAGGNARRQPTSQRSNLTNPKRTWWPAQMREGLTLRALSPEEVEEKERRCRWGRGEAGVGVEGEKWWNVEYSKRYKGVTLSFMRTVLSGDPEGFYRIIRQIPYHADTLLQLAELSNHREEHSTASDFIDRALFSYERAFVGAFTFTGGGNRLDFDRVENRPFFLALHRQIIDLQRRGTFRTAFEFSRLLYSLDPWGDPHGALLHLDFLSVKAGMAQWAIDLWAFFESASAQSSTGGEVEDEKARSGLLKGRANVLALPGWAYARALALRTVGKDDEATEALRQAIVDWPSVVPLLADKAEIPLSSDIRAQNTFRIFTKDYYSKEPEVLLHLLSHLYVQRSFQLWKIPETATWFRKTVTSLSESSSLPGSPTITPAYNDRFLPLVTSTTPSTSMFSSAPTTSMSPFAHSVYRHVISLGPSAQRFLSYLPENVVNGPGNTLACDPLPPPTQLTAYNDAFFSGADDIFAVGAHGGRGGRRRNAAQEQRLLEQMIPDPVMRRQFQDFFDANPAIREQFPGGLVDFAQVAANLPEDVMDEMMIAAAMANNGGQGGGAGGQGRMPGGMPEDEREREWVQLQFLENQQEEDRERRQREAEEAEDGMLERRAMELEEEDIVARQRREAENENDEDDEAEEEYEDEEEEEEAVALPTRVLRNLMSRFWGAAPAAEDSDESSEDDQPQRRVVDDGGVD